MSNLYLHSPTRWDTDREEVLHIFMATNRVSLVNNYIFMVIRVGGRVRERKD